MSRTHLFGSIRDTVNQWIDSHSNVKIGVTEPLNSFVNIGYRAKGNLATKQRNKTVQKVIFNLCVSDLEMTAAILN